MLRKIIVSFLLIILLTGCEINNVKTEKGNIDEELISSLSVKLIDEKNPSKAELYFDGNIKLRVKDSEAIVLESTSDNDINALKQQYSLADIGNGVIAVVNKNHTAVRSYMILDLFKYKENRIYNIFSSNDILAKIQDINNENGTIDFSLPKFDVICTMKFTEEELNSWKQKKSQLESNNIKVDSDYYKDIQDNIIFSPVDYFIKDIGEQSDKEFLVLIDVYSVGSKSPTIRDRAIIDFVISADEIGYKDIVFERDSIDGKHPFAYFK